MFCIECGTPCGIDETGVSNHITEHGDIDYDSDADHTALPGDLD